MNPHDTALPPDQPSDKRPHRDWLLLPLLGLATVLLLSGATELLARFLYSDDHQTAMGEDCLKRSPDATETRGIPNCHCTEKLPDGELTEYHFNSQGYRAGGEWTPRKAGVYRIVLTGTSYAAGMRVPREESFAALLPTQLARQTGRPVDLYNQAIPHKYDWEIARHFNEVLAAQPNMVLWAISSWDLTAPGIPETSPSDSNHINRTVWKRLHTQLDAAWQARSFAPLVTNIFKHTRSSTLLSALLYRSPSLYAKSFLMQDNSQVLPLKADPGPEWQSIHQRLDASIASMAAQSHAAGVPLVVVLLPNHAEAILATRGQWPVGYNPFRLDQELREMVTRHGGIYLDMLADLHMDQRLQDGYTPVDGHPTPYGHKVMTELLSNEILRAHLPALSSPLPSQTKNERVN